MSAESVQRWGLRPGGAQQRTDGAANAPADRCHMQPVYCHQAPADGSHYPTHSHRTMPPSLVACAGDAVVTFNFRADRMIEISQALEYPNFDKFDRKRWPQVDCLFPCLPLAVVRIIVLGVGRAWSALNSTSSDRKCWPQVGRGAVSLVPCSGRISVRVGRPWSALNLTIIIVVRVGRLQYLNASAGRRRAGGLAGLLACCLVSPSV